MTTHNYGFLFEKSEGGQKVQTSSDRISKFWGVMHSMELQLIILQCVFEAAKRVDLKSSHPKKQTCSIYVFIFAVTYTTFAFIVLFCR